MKIDIKNAKSFIEHCKALASINPPVAVLETEKQIIVFGELRYLVLRRIEKRACKLAERACNEWMPADEKRTKLSW